MKKQLNFAYETPRRANDNFLKLGCVSQHKFCINLALNECQIHLTGRRKSALKRCGKKSMNCIHFRGHLSVPLQVFVHNCEESGMEKLHKTEKRKKSRDSISLYLLCYTISATLLLCIIRFRHFCAYSFSSAVFT